MKALRDLFAGSAPGSLGLLCERVISQAKLTALVGKDEWRKCVLDTLHEQLEEIVLGVSIATVGAGALWGV